MKACKVKICGLRRQEDVNAAATAGAHLGGFIFVPSSPRAISPEQAAALYSPGLLRVGVFVDGTVEELAAVVRCARLDMVQLHGEQTASCACRLRELSTARGVPLRVIRTVWPARYGSRSALEAALAHAALHADVFLLDAGRAGGGSGAPLPWESLRNLRLPLPWLLAGGLTPANLGQAVQLCQPWGVDVNSGVEDAPGCKNVQKIRDALRAVS